MSSRPPVTSRANRVQRLCSQHAIWSSTARKKRSKGRKPGPAVHDDLVQRGFTAARPDAVWLTDITECWTSEGKLYICAIKDLCSDGIVGYAIDERMTAALADTALRTALARRQPDGTVVVHSDRGSQFRSRRFRGTLKDNGLVGSMAGYLPPGTTPRWSRSSPCSRRTSSTGTAGRPARISTSRS